MKYELKRIPVFPVIKVTFIVSLVLGFFLGILYAMFFGLIFGALSSVGQFQGQNLDIPRMGVGMLMIFMPVFLSIFSAVFNTILALLAVAVYNFVVKFAGGLELELEPTDAPSPTQPHPMDVPGAIYAQASMTPRYAPPPPPVYPTATPPPVPPAAPQPPTPPPDPQADKNRPSQFPYE
jgi:hypothetical protein